MSSETLKLRATAGRAFLDMLPESMTADADLASIALEQEWAREVDVRVSAVDGLWRADKAVAEARSEPSDA